MSPDPLPDVAPRSEIPAGSEVAFAALKSVFTAKERQAKAGAVQRRASGRPAPIRVNGAALPVRKVKKPAKPTKGSLAVFDAQGKIIGFCDPADVMPLASGVTKTIGPRPASAVTVSDVYAALGRLTAVRKSRQPVGRTQQVVAGTQAYTRLSAEDRAQIDRLLRAARKA